MHYRYLDWPAGGGTPNSIFGTRTTWLCWPLPAAPYRPACVIVALQSLLAICQSERDLADQAANMSMSVQVYFSLQEVQVTDWQYPEMLISGEKT